LFQQKFVSNDEKDTPSTQQWDKLVFKTMKTLYRSEDSELEDDEVTYEGGFGFDPNDKYTFLKYKEYMRTDAMVIELLSSSPHAIDIYSHCAMSSVIEFAPTEMEEYILPTKGFSPKTLVRRRATKNNDLDEHEHVEHSPLNDYISPEEKLEIALEMAKCIAAMHGFEDGAIAHVDVQVGQFFRGKDGRIKIVDYNRAEPLLYDAKNEEYCRWANGRPGNGSLRAPEENTDAPLTEKIDVYSLGNVFYALLTGTVVWEKYGYDERTHNIVEGIQLPIPAFYNESPSSRLLVRAIEACWTYEVEERPSVFDLVELLEQAVAEHPVVDEAWG